MPAESKAQQRLMGMALAAKRGKGEFGDKIKETADSMSEKQLRDFAKTKHGGLPEKKAFQVLPEHMIAAGIGAASLYTLKRQNKKDKQAREKLNAPISKKAFVLGFVKRAGEYGIGASEALELIKYN
jgi:hypothetical protein